MKIKNISSEERNVFPNFGPAFRCAPGAITPELDELVAAELVRDLPSVWEFADVKPLKKSKKES